jgi:hypothetical protein
MKSLLIALAALASVNLFAIEFITEEEVAQELGASKVIEVSKYSVRALIPAGSQCDQDFLSRSARAYVVKKGHDASLYLTPSGLRGLNSCAAL